MAAADLIRGYKTRSKNMTNLKASTHFDPSNPNLLSKNGNSIRSIKKQLRSFKYHSKAPLKNKQTKVVRGKQIVFESSVSCLEEPMALAQNQIKTNNVAPEDFENHDQQRRDFDRSGDVQTQENDNHAISNQISTQPNMENLNDPERKIRHNARRNIGEYRDSQRVSEISDSRHQQMNPRGWVQSSSSLEKDQKTRSGRTKKFEEKASTRNTESLTDSMSQSLSTALDAGSDSELNYHIYQDKQQVIESKSGLIENRKKSFGLYSEMGSQMQRSQGSQLRSSSKGSSHRDNREQMN